MAKKETDWHNRGQEDAKDGRNNPPHPRTGWLGEMLMPLSKEERQDYDAYKEGRNNYEKTKK